MRIVYVGGWMRSGTTLLAELLDGRPGVLAVGEVSGLWDAVARGGPCSCGDPLTGCPVWGPALRDALGEDDTAAARLSATMTSRFRTRRLPGLRRRWADDADLRRLVERTDRVLRSVMASTGSDVLVDTSKLLPGLALQRLMATERRVDVVHMLRDPRAVAAAEMRTAGRSAGNADFVPPGSGPVGSLFRWYWTNLTVAAAPRLFDVGYRTLRYETLAGAPVDTMTSLCRELGIDDAPRSTTGASVGGDTHIAVGNPARLTAGHRPVRVDERWRDELTGATRLLVQAGAAPGRMALRRSR